VFDHYLIGSIYPLQAVADLQHAQAMALNAISGKANINNPI
jgi:hypothetical protein